MSNYFKGVLDGKSVLEQLHDSLLKYVADKEDDFEFTFSNQGMEIPMTDIKSQVQAVANKKLSKEILEELDAEEPIDAEQVIASATEASKETKNAEGKKV